MILLTPDGATTAFGNASFYALLGEHILGISWDDNNTSVFNAGRTDSPDPDAFSEPAVTYAEHDETGPGGWSYADGRLGVWFYNGLWILTFSGIGEAELTLDSDEFVSFDGLGEPGSYSVMESVDSDGRLLFEGRINLLGVNELIVVDEGAVTPIVSWYPDNEHPEYGGVAYDGVVVTPIPTE